MFEKFICEEAIRCKKTCSHSEPHEFDKEYCNDVCSEMDKVKCVEIE